MTWVSKLFKKKDTSPKVYMKVTEEIEYDHNKINQELHDDHIEMKIKREAMRWYFEWAQAEINHALDPRTKIIEDRLGFRWPSRYIFIPDLPCIIYNHYPYESKWDMETMNEYLDREFTRLKEENSMQENYVD